MRKTLKNYLVWTLLIVAIVSHANADVITLPDGTRVAIDRWEDFVDDGPKQPKLGFSGTLVKLPQDMGVGMRINRVDRRSPASKMGLERGDIIVAIDNTGFTTWKGYYHALRRASQKPSIVLINVRTGRLIRRSCHIPHQQDWSEPQPPDSTYLAITLEEDFRER